MGDHPTASQTTTRQKFTGSGFINLEKPKGWTSHDCIAKLRRLLKVKRIGHGGTLDPMATGVLPIAVGKVTRLLQYLPKEKAYRGIVRFGVKTNTDDLEGEVIFEQACPQLAIAAVEQFLPEFIGTITQTPPAFSAIQKDGKRLYELARQGIEVEVPSRQVEIYDLQVLAWREGEFPELELEIRCGEGTYIRAIARDLGEKLGVGATLAGLERTFSAGFGLESSLTFEAVTAQIEANAFQCLTANQALAHLPKIILDEAQGVNWSYGKKILWTESMTIPLNSPLAVFNQADECLGVGEFRVGKDDETTRVLAGLVVLSGH